MHISSMKELVVDIRVECIAEVNTDYNLLIMETTTKKIPQKPIQQSKTRNVVEKCNNQKGICRNQVNTNRIRS